MRDPLKHMGGAVRFLIIAAVLPLAACQSESDIPGAPVSGASASCRTSCNRDYDYCADRGMSGNVFGRQPDQASSASANAVCPDELKSCLLRCSP